MARNLNFSPTFSSHNILLQSMSNFGLKSNQHLLKKKTRKEPVPDPNVDFSILAILHSFFLPNNQVLTSIDFVAS
jgi:hypothetical protein